MLWRVLAVSGLVAVVATVAAYVLRPRDAYGPQRLRERLAEYHWSYQVESPKGAWFSGYGTENGVRYDSVSINSQAVGRGEVWLEIDGKPCHIGQPFATALLEEGGHETDADGNTLWSATGPGFSASVTVGKDGRIIYFGIHAVDANRHDVSMVLHYGDTEIRKLPMSAAKLEAIIGPGGRLEVDMDRGFDF